MMEMATLNKKKLFPLRKFNYEMEMDAPCPRRSILISQAFEVKICWKPANWCPDDDGNQLNAMFARITRLALSFLCSDARADRYRREVRSLPLSLDELRWAPTMTNASCDPLSSTKMLRLARINKFSIKPDALKWLCLRRVLQIEK